jgi:uncharacterized metal-binding protein YceD (DUF177 family)
LVSDRFASALPIASIRDGDRLDLVADDGERATICERLGLLSLDALKAHAVLKREGEAIAATGRVQASCAQSCVATGEPVPAHVDEAFALSFVPEPSGRPDEEVELGGSELDTVFHDGKTIAIGDALVDTLSLALDPYPRSAGAEAALKDAGVISEEEAGPFAALAALKGKLPGE